MQQTKFNFERIIFQKDNKKITIEILQFNKMSLNSHKFSNVHSIFFYHDFFNNFYISSYLCLYNK